MEARVATPTILASSCWTRAPALVNRAQQVPKAARPSARGCAPGSASRHRAPELQPPGPVDWQPAWRMAPSTGDQVDQFLRSPHQGQPDESGAHAVLSLFHRTLAVADDAEVHES